MEKLKRYIIFFIGLYINSLGVALITKASLGTSPISSIPYVLSLNFPFTLGNFTIFFSLFLILVYDPSWIRKPSFISDEIDLSVNWMSDSWIWCVYRSTC